MINNIFNNERSSRDISKEEINKKDFDKKKLASVIGLNVAILIIFPPLIIVSLMGGIYIGASNLRIKNLLIKERQKTALRENAIADYIDFISNFSIIERKIKSLKDSKEESELIDLLEEIRVKKIENINSFFNESDIDKEIKKYINLYPINEVINICANTTLDEDRLINSNDSVENMFFDTLTNYYSLGGNIEETKENEEELFNFYKNRLTKSLLNRTFKTLKNKINLNSVEDNNLLVNMFSINLWERVYNRLKEENEIRQRIDFGIYDEELIELKRSLVDNKEEKVNNSNREKKYEEIEEIKKRLKKSLNKISISKDNIEQEKSNDLYYKEIKDNEDIITYENYIKDNNWIILKNNLKVISILENKIKDEYEGEIEDDSVNKEYYDKVIRNLMVMDNYIRGINKEINYLERQNINKEKVNKLRETIKITKENLKESLNTLCEYTDNKREYYESLINKQIKIETKVIRQYK